MAKALILGAALAAGYYALVFDDGSSQRAAIAAARQQYADKKKQMEEATQKLEQAAAYKKIVLEVGGTVSQLLASIPEKFATADLMRLVSDEAKVAGSSMSTLVPKPVEVSKVAKEFDEIAVSLDLNGSFLQQMTFLSNLTKIKQILVLRKFTIALAKEGRGEEPTTTNLSAEIVAYRYRGSAAAAADKKDEGAR